MTTVTPKKKIVTTKEEYTEAAWQGISSSREVAKKNMHWIEPQHLMKALLEQQSGLAHRIFNSVGVDITKLLKATDGFIRFHTESRTKVEVLDQSGALRSYTGRSVLSLIERAKVYKEEYGDDTVSVEHLVLGFVEDKIFGKKLFEDFQVSLKSLKDAIRAIRETQSVIDQVSEGKNQVLQKYGKDLTAMARAGKLDHVIGRDDVIRRCIQILCRKTKNNPVLIGEPGVGKTAISEGLAQRIAEGNVPPELTKLRLISLEMGDTINSGDFEARLKLLLQEATGSDEQIILFINDIHTVVGAGATDRNMGAGNFLKSMFGYGELRCIGATTFDAYRKCIEKDLTFERQFQQVHVSQPSREDTISILRGLRESYESHHRVRISDNALVSAVVLSDRYVNERFLPGKAIDLVDEAAAKLKIDMTSKPTALNEIDCGILKLEMDKLSLMKDKDKASNERSQWIVAEQSESKGQLESVARNEVNDYKMSGESKLTGEVSADDVAEIFSIWTGIPLCKLRHSEMERLLHLEEELHKCFVG